MIQASIITIGDEILIGQIVDSNSAYIAKMLNSAGIRIQNKYSIGDQKESIKNTLDALVGKSDVIIFTGGLGPTKDDITKDVLNEFFGGKLIRHQETFKMLEDYFKSRNRTFEPVNQGQADVPDTCSVLVNKNGTAPGMMFEKDGSLIFSLPGVPYEMEALLDEQVIPIIQNKFKLAPIAHATLQTVGIAESSLMLLISDWENNLPSDVKLAYLPSFGIVRLSLTCWEAGKYSEKDLYKIFSPLYNILGDAIFAEGDTTMEEVVFALLRNNNLHISYAESCTGGYLAHRTTHYAGSSKIYNGSIITYSNELKMQELHVRNDDLELVGAVSEEVVRQMAKAVRNKFNSDFSIATSGIAGPDGGTDSKPIGTVWVAIAGPNKISTKQFKFANNRERNIKLTHNHSFNLLRLEIIQFLKTEKLS